MEVCLVLNGHELHAAVDEGEKTVLEVASGQMDRVDLTHWVAEHITPLSHE